ncbi:MAG: hypothetical protein Q7J85_01175 [Bacillota bacterium]|nr:hypothetical protein [Bacillota bacterium]
MNDRIEEILNCFRVDFADELLIVHSIGYAGWVVAKVQMTPNCMEPAMLLEFEEVDGPSMML